MGNKRSASFRDVLVIGGVVGALVWWCAPADPLTPAPSTGDAISAGDAAILSAAASSRSPREKKAAALQEQTPRKRWIDLTPDERKVRDLADYRASKAKEQAKKDLRRTKKEFEALVAEGMNVLKQSGVLAKVDRERRQAWVGSNWSKLSYEEQMNAAVILRGYCLGFVGSATTKEDLPILDLDGKVIAIYDGETMGFPP